MVTITTVGFGEITPHTAIGKLIIMFAALWGAFLVSLIVVVATNIFSLEKSQRKAM